MAGLSPVALALVWVGLMAVVTLPAAAVAARRTPRQPGARVLAFAMVEQIAVLFVAAAVLALFVFPDAVGLAGADAAPVLVVVIGGYAALSAVLLFWILMPVLRRAGRQAVRAASGAASSSTVRRR